MELKEAHLAVGDYDQLQPPKLQDSSAFLSLALPTENDTVQANRNADVSHVRWLHFDALFI